MKKASADKSEIKRLIELSKSYALQISSVKELQYLRSLDCMQKENDLTNIRTLARRVGLELPKVRNEYCNIFISNGIINPMFVQIF